MRGTTRLVVDTADVGDWTRAWDGLVRERADGPTRFVAEEGPFAHYERHVEVRPLGHGRAEVTSTVEFRLAIPYWWFLFAPFVRAALRHPGAPMPWWGPAARMDARAAQVLGTLCAASVVTGFLGTSMTQTITYVADGFGYHGDRPQSVALAVTRLSVLLTLGIVGLADRHGRRRLLVTSATAGCILAGLTAAAPSLPAYTAAQTLLRGAAAALTVLIAVQAAEELPAGARAFGASMIGLSAGLGAGACVLALPFADLGDDGWRLIFLLPLVLGLPLVRTVATRLPESRRFARPHVDASVAGHGERLLLLGVAAFLIQVFSQPASQLQNEFLRDERAYSAFAISMFTVCTVTPASIGVILGGHLADTKGRRVVAVFGLAGGVFATTAQFFSAGALMWGWSFVGAVFGGAALPAIGVYGPELFPTGARGRANGILVGAGVLGSSTGLLAAGAMSDAFGGLGKALAVLSVGPALLIVLILLRFPETAGRELEELNPEDRAPSPDPAAS